MSDVDVFCRTCMCQFPKKSIEKVERYNIFEIPFLADKLMRCSSLPVRLSDAYPRLLCGKCFKMVTDIYEFQRMCRESLKTFKDILTIAQEIDCGTLKYTESSSEKPKNSQCELRCEEGTLEIDFETEDFIIEDDDDDEFDVNHSTEIEALEEKLINEGTEVTHANDSKNDNGVTYKPQAWVELNDIEKSFSPESKASNYENTLLEAPSESEEECVVDTASEEDDDESDFDLQQDVPPLDYNPATILKYPFHCVLCPKVFTYKHRLTAHIRRHQGLGAYPCNRKNCTRAYSRLCDLRQHLREHDGIPREIYKCDIDNCGKEYTTKSAINLHMRKQHNFGSTSGTRKYVCDVCGAVLSNARTLQDHHFMHVDKSYWPFGCDENGCTSRFRNVTQLKEHKNRHAGIKPFVCPHCDKRFCTSSNLNVHVNFHTKEKKWPCLVCTRVFYTPASLRLHVQREHEPDSNAAVRYPCRMCEKTLSTHTARKYHEMRHTGEKPYVCDECGRRFTQPSGLKTHKRIHMQMESRKDYACRICDRAFTSSVSLKHHEMKHSGEKPYECDQCYIKFRYPASLSRHRKQNLCKQLKSTNEPIVQEEIEDTDISLIDFDGQYEFELS